MKVGDYVNQKGTVDPTGTIESINNHNIARVRWGVADGRIFEDDFPLDDLQLVSHEIIPPEEILKRQAENSRGAVSRYSSIDFKSTGKT